MATRIPAGGAGELGRLGHRVEAFEPEGAWSLANLVADGGDAEGWRGVYPGLRTTVYPPGADPADLIGDADLVIVHEWNEPALVAAVGEARRRGRAVYAVVP